MNPAVTAAEQIAFNLPVAGLTTCPMATANQLLAEWGHYLGPCKRPFGSQAWILELDGRPVSVAVSASIVSPHVTYRYQIPVYDITGGGQGVEAGAFTIRRRLPRGRVVELARLCSAQRWATRPMLRLWREIAAPRWPYWAVAAAVSYSQNARGDGALYRFDGWEKITDKAGRTGGGGAWTRPRYATDAAHGRKTLWIWRYPEPAR